MLQIRRDLYDDIVAHARRDHPDEAYPSRTDISYAAEPDAHYVLVSTSATGRDDGPVEFRSFRIVEGVVSEEEVEVLPHGS